MLSGGAARGLAHIGVIEELEKQGFEIKSIAGNSMGAFIAAIYAMGSLNEYKKWVLTLDRMDVFNLIDFTLSSQGLIKGNNEQLKKSIYKKKIISYRKKLNRILPKGKKENLNYFTLLNKSTNILAHNLSMMNIGKYNPDIVINVSNQSANTFDFFKAEELIEVGKIASKSSIEQYKNNKNEVS